MFQEVIYNLSFSFIRCAFEKLWEIFHKAQLVPLNSVIVPIKIIANIANYCDDFAYQYLINLVCTKQAQIKPQLPFPCLYQKLCFT